VNVHVRVDHDVGNDHRANATHPLGEGERLRITQQVDVRLIAAQRGEAVDPVQGRPFSRIRELRKTLDRHSSAFLTTSGTQRSEWTTRRERSICRFAEVGRRFTFTWQAGDQIVRNLASTVRTVATSQAVRMQSRAHV
jgi:hypothetical protein